MRTRLLRQSIPASIAVIAVIEVALLMLALYAAAALQEGDRYPRHYSLVPAQYVYQKLSNFPHRPESAPGTASFVRDTQKVSGS